MEKEMAVLQRDLTLIEEFHGNRALNLVLTRVLSRVTWQTPE
jgi:hypothetical protein